jgi:dTDP-4-amino-4,6-dideoxygalactose transaminase
MVSAIPRNGARTHPTTRAIAAACRERGEFMKGPHIAAFEQAFASRLGAGHAVLASFGRTGLYFLLKALDLPRGSEVVVPGLTFWAVPEIVRVAGLKVRFADVDRTTFCLDASSLAAALTGASTAVVATHLFGLPCEMEAILDLARRRGLVVIEDCAHALGATYRGRPVGSFGDAAFFSFQSWMPLNCSGGGMAVARDPAVAARLRHMLEALPWPHEKRTANKLLVGRLQRRFTAPRLFGVTGLPVLCLADLVGARPNLYSWDPPRRLDPLPEEYLERCSNVQAALGLAGLDLLDVWTAATRSHAHRVGVALADLAGIRAPCEQPERTHVYHRYCLSVLDRDATMRACLRRGVDVGLHDVQHCPRLDLFAAERTPTPGADHVDHAVQVPIHASLTDRQMRRVVRVVRTVLTATGARPLSA